MLRIRAVNKLGKALDKAEESGAHVLMEQYGTLGQSTGSDDIPYSVGFLLKAVYPGGEERLIADITEDNDEIQLKLPNYRRKKGKQVCVNIYEEELADFGIPTPLNAFIERGKGEKVAYNLLF